MNPTASDVHVNRPMTNISIAYLQRQDVYIASRCFPNIPVSKQSDIYFRFEKGEFNRDDMELRAPSTESSGSGYDVDVAPAYFCREWSTHHDVPDQRRNNADQPLNPDREATIFLTQKALLRRERLFAGQYFVAGKWTQDYTGVSSGANGTTTHLQWNDDASDPIKTIRTLKRQMLESTGFEPNTLVLGPAVWDTLIDHPDMVDRVKYGQTAGSPAKVTPSVIAALLEVDKILVGKAIVNTAKKGAPAQQSFVFGKHMLLVHAAMEPGLMTPTAGYTFSWTGQPGAGDDGVRIRSFRHEPIRSDRFEVDLCVDMAQIGADLGTFISGIVA